MEVQDAADRPLAHHIESGSWIEYVACTWAPSKVQTGASLATLTACATCPPALMSKFRPGLKSRSFDSEMQDSASPVMQVCSSCSALHPMRKVCNQIWDMNWQAHATPTAPNPQA